MPIANYEREKFKVDKAKKKLISKKETKIKGKKGQKKTASYDMLPAGLEPATSASPRLGSYNVLVLVRSSNQLSYGSCD